MATTWSYGKLASGTEYLGSTPYTDTSGGFANPQNAYSGSTSSSSTASNPTFSGGKSIYDDAMARNAQKDMISYASNAAARNRTPGSFITGYKTQEYGRADYDAALANYRAVYGDIKVDKAKVEALAAQFARGGSYGTGRRQEARDVVGQGVARDTASAVASGMSSMSSSRGLNTLAGRELATLYGNIDDTRAQLELQATGMMTPYTQMLASLQYPTASSYIDRITSPKYSG